MSTTTAWLNPGTALDVIGPGPSSWINVNNALTPNGSMSDSYFFTGMDTALFREVRLVRAGSIRPTNRAANEHVLYTPTYNPYGGAADLWGDTWTPEDLNDPNFGVVVAIGNDDGSGLPGAITDETHYLRLTNFGLNIPPSATINGIEIQILADATAAGGGTNRFGIDVIQIRVTYTWSPKVIAEGRSTGIVYSTLTRRIVPDKRYDYKVSAPGGEYVGQWNDVGSVPSYRVEQNNLLTSIDVTLARNESSNPGVPTIGDESDLEDNLEVDLVAYYGTFEEIVTETGEPIVDENNELIYAEVGAPAGRRLFSGYVSDWGLDFGTDDDVVATLLPHSMELDNIMLETDDTVSISNYPAWTGGFVGIAGGGPGDNLTMQQTLSVSTNVKISRITLYGRRWEGIVSGRLDLYDTDGSYLGTAYATPPDFQNFEDTDFVFPDYVTLHSSFVGLASMFISCDQSKTGGNATYPLQLATQPVSDAGRLYVDSGSGMVDQGTDLRYKIWKAGGNTTVTFTDIDPSDLLMRLIDFAAARGSRVRYLPGSIQRTGITIPSVTFQTNTVLECVNMVPSLCPADWFTSFDFGESIVYLSARPTSPRHYITQGKNGSLLNVKRSIRMIKNQAYFSGAGSPALFVKVTDQEARARWRPGLLKMSDIRVDDIETARILAHSEIDRNKNPRYNGSVVIADGGIAIEDYTLGELLGFQGWGELLDVLSLQLVGFNYSPEVLTSTLETLLPKQNERIDQVKRNLALQEQADNPAAPS